MRCHTKVTKDDKKWLEQDPWELSPEVFHESDLSCSSSILKEMRKSDWRKQDDSFREI